MNPSWMIGKPQPCYIEGSLKPVKYQIHATHIGKDIDEGVLSRYFGGKIRFPYRGHAIITYYNYSHALMDYQVDKIYKKREPVNLIFEAGDRTEDEGRTVKSPIRAKDIQKNLTPDEQAVCEKIILLHKTKELDIKTVKANLRNFKTLQLNQKRNILGEFLYPKVEDKVGRNLLQRLRECLSTSKS
eukprot:TRINITY_DN1159_c0_g1_i4.p1 TRINITY_DN1159_c0_g1~~TRINITY_DN1159_c0_g1_i4.p1  ORF type:complete len:186 (+),score=25.05 TRINITY_DN1159_c0_g1_i4:121-678(+)